VLVSASPSAIAAALTIARAIIAQSTSVSQGAADLSATRPFTLASSSDSIVVANLTGFWFDEDGIGGSWTPESGTTGPWTPESGVTGPWVEEDELP
jgi:hypothetical protein